MIGRTEFRTVDEDMKEFYENEADNVINSMSEEAEEAAETTETAAEEAEQAMELGCRFLKYFPAEAAGGVKFLKSLIAPYKHLGVRFMPTGGVTSANAAEYLTVPEIAAVGGT